VWQSTTPSRRLTTRVEALEDVWVYVQCSGREDVCRIRDLSVGGLFIEAAKPKAAVGTMAKVEFLVQEGQVRAEAVVRHVEPQSGIGFKFTAIREEDRSRLTALVTRLRSLQRDQRGE
jgi:hypothetical protein